MGISGLLPVLKSITEAKVIDEYRGKTLAIDGYCWLHRAIYSCSEEICLGRPTDKYIKYFMERVTALEQNQITPYVVFDGGPLPMKKGTEEERRKSRQKNRELGVQYYNSRNFAEARKCFVRAADVSPFMAHRVIQALKARGVRYVVAPYEADAQLAFLMKNGLADGVITEDSDCLPFGCHTVLFKMDRDGVAQEIRTQNLKRNKGLIFHMFTDEMFLEMCILSGCDYLPSIPGFGLKKAYAAIKQHGNFTKVVRALRLEGKVRIPLTYEEDFKRARLTFLHQRVYDPSTKRLVSLTPAAPDMLGMDMDFLGPMLSDDVATAIAVGDMDPITMEVFPTAGRPSGPQVPRPLVAAPPPRPQPQLLDPRMFSRHAASSGGTPANPTQPTGTKGASPRWKRKFPRSFGAQGRTSLLQALSSSASTPASSSGATSSPRISHFFASDVKKMSPPTELEKKSSSSCLVASEVDTYESQDPIDVDVSKSISFEPSDKKMIEAASSVPITNKENNSPSSGQGLKSAASSVSEAPPVKENAFARMMRAGARQQKTSGAKRGGLGAASSRRPVMKKLRTLSYHASSVRMSAQSKATTPHEPEAEAEPEDTREEPALAKDNQRDDIDSLSKESAGECAAPAAKAKPASSGNWMDRFRFKA